MEYQEDASVAQGDPANSKLSTLKALLSLNRKASLVTRTKRSHKVHVWIGVQD